MQYNSLPEEKEILLQLSNDSEKAFEKIYNFYSTRLYGKLVKMLKSPVIAGEILQDVFLKIWELRQGIDADKSFRSYLFRIAENKVYDFFRKTARDRKFAKQLMHDSVDEYSHIEEIIIKKEDISLLQEIINELPPQRQQVFRLCKLDCKSYKQASTLLGISTSTISDHIVKANNYIRSHNSYR